MEIGNWKLERFATVKYLDWTRNTQEKGGLSRKSSLIQIFSFIILCQVRDHQNTRQVAQPHTTDRRKRPKVSLHHRPSSSTMTMQHLLCPTFTPQHRPYKLPQALVKRDNALLHLIFIIKSLLLLYYPSHVQFRPYKLPQALVR